MDETFIDLVTCEYGLKRLEVTQKFPTNGQREAYLLETDLGRLVLKLTDPGRPEEIVRSDCEILEYLARYDFPAPRMVHTREGNLYLPRGERFFYLYHLIEGRIPVPSHRMLTECGALLARLHTIPVDETARRSMHRPAPILADAREWLLGAPDTPEQQNMAADLLDLIARFPSFEGLPETLVHTDPYFVNLVEGEDGKLYLIDWEDGGVSYPLMDVGYVGHLCTYLPHDRANLGLDGDGEITWRPDWAQAFLDGYQSVRRLTALERELFPWAVRLNYIEYIWEWGERRIIPENYRRMKLLEELRPVWDAHPTPAPGSGG